MSPGAAHRRIGQLVIVGFDGLTVPADLRSLAQEFDLGGVILFARNVEAPEQVAELAGDLQELAADRPLWISLDQEGGRVARLRSPFTEWPPMATLGRSGDDLLAGRFARALAAELRSVGVSLDFAPVLDVHTNPDNPVIGDRALGERPEVVARLGAAIIRGLQEGGVAACGKHFPGHGDTSTDSHVDLPVVEHPPERLRSVEFVPFRAAIDAGVAAIMMGHLLVPALDGERLSGFSPRTIDGILRSELGFSGLVLSDDLDMRACAARCSLDQASVAAIAAGCDGVLLCTPDHHRQAGALEALVRAVESGSIPFARLDDALTRHRHAKETFLSGWRRPSPRLARAAVGLGEHRMIADEMARYGDHA
jgi:beta-N-acetylhexosaminidase